MQVDASVLEDDLAMLRAILEDVFFFPARQFLGFIVWPYAKDHDKHPSTKNK